MMSPNHFSDDRGSPPHHVRQTPLQIIHVAANFLRIWSIYSMFRYLSQTGASVVLFLFACLVPAAMLFLILQKPWKGRPLSNTQVVPSIINGFITAMYLVLWGKGLKSCGPVRAILGEYSGAVLGVLSGVLYGRRSNLWKNKNTSQHKIHRMMLRANPTVHVPPWPNHDDQTAEILSSYFGYDNNNNAGDLTGAGDYTTGDFSTGDYSSGDYHLREALAALQRYLPSNEFNDSDLESPASAAADSTVDAYSCDHFRMYEFKIRRCARGRSHDWTECPYAHPGEKARRRDPRKFHYSGTACPDFRKGNCKKGDACEHAHGVFECWLHPARYRTQPCKDGTSCRRRVCFFAHTPEQLRLNVQQSPSSSSRSVNSPDSYDGSPLRQMVTITTPPESPSSPMSPMANDVVASLRNLQLGRMKTMPINRNVTIGSPVYGSGSPVFGSPLRSGFLSLPNTPTKKPGLGRVGGFDLWDQSCEEEPIMERVESGRDIRAKMFEKLSKENSLENENGNSGFGLESGQPGPDVGWVCDLLK